MAWSAVVAGAGLVLACGGSAARPPAPPAFSRPATADDETPARWVLVPSRAVPHAQQQSRISERAAVIDGIRVLEQSGGTPEQSAVFFPGSDVTAVELPAALGGGFLFAAEVEAETAFWRADTWTAAPTPLTRLPERADQVDVGFGRVYARLADSGDTVAFDPRTGQTVNLGPLPSSPSYLDFQFWDEWFGAVHTDARGILATFDGGATWHPTGVMDDEASLISQPDGILVTTSEQRNLLSPDGKWTNDYEGDPSEYELGPVAPASPLGKNPLELAVLHGSPIGQHRAVVANWGHVGVVDTATGAVKRLRLRQYPGSAPCQGLPLGDGAGLVCLLTSGETALYSVRQDLSLATYAKWQTRVNLWSNDNGNVVAEGACPGPASAPPAATRKRAFEGHSSPPLENDPPDQVCVSNGKGSPRTLPVPNLGASRIVALRDGRVAVLRPPRPGAAGTLRLTAKNSLEPSKPGPLTFPESTPERLRTMAEGGLWLNDGGERSDGKLAFWVATASRLFGVTVSLEGQIQFADRVEADLRRTHVGGPRAFELSSGEVAWQSLDYGQTWQEVSVPRGLTAASTRDTREVVGCSEVGCSFGNWLRVGHVAEGSLVPTEAPLPQPLKLRGPAYSQWGLTCYATGQHEGPRGPSATAAFSVGQGRPRHGSNHGFVGSGLATTTSSDVASGANRPFLGVPRPSVPKGSYAFDMGADGAQQFRSYAWGLDGEAWRTTGGWLTRVADRFSLAGLWSTAPTRAPWANLLSAAQLFGADRANRYSSTWQLSLDPGERGGLLRITTTGTTELHFIEEGSATVSVGNSSFGPISGVVKVQKSWYFGSQEGNRFHVYRTRNGAVEEFADFPIGDPIAPFLTRNTQGTAIALWLRAPAGTWHLFPIKEDGTAEEPITVGREELNQEWPRCADGELGYFAVASLPLSRFTPSDGSEVLDFEAVPQEWKAEAVTARTIVSASTRCVDALAARLARNHEPVVLPAKTPPAAGSIPLTLTDRLNDVRYGFQCLP